MNSVVNSIATLMHAPDQMKEKRLTNSRKDGLTEFIQSIVSKNTEKKAFYVLDLGVVMEHFEGWKLCLPEVQPFYAVKCNLDPNFLATMVALGSSVDCGSRAEIESILSLGVSPDRIIYANPCKMESHIKYAASVGVNLSTFDSINELEKIRKWHPKCELLIRIKAPDESGAKQQLGFKYGAFPEEVLPLLQAAQAAHTSVRGVAFHVGSGSTNAQAYRKAIAAAKTVFEAAAQLGMPPMTMLDIGGGFVTGKPFKEAASTIKDALEAYFPNRSNLTVIAEPGRFLAETAFTLATNIFGKRVRGEVRQYWINDGIYGSMRSIWDGYMTNIQCTPLACSSNPQNPSAKGLKTYSSTVFGPTCDSCDMILKDIPLPELQVDDWLVFPNMGAYTASAGSCFNGFNISDIPVYLAADVYCK